MIYFEARSKLQHMQQVLVVFERIREIEKHVRAKLVEEGASWLGPYNMLKDIREQASQRNPDYSNLRADFAKMISRANAICDELDVPWHRAGRSAPMEGGAPFEGSIFDLVLERPSDILEIDNDVRDTVNKCIGALELQKSREFRQLINPLFWLRKLVVFLMRLPYKAIEASGFDVAKVEDHFLGKLTHLIYIILLSLFFIWLGVESLSDLATLLSSAIRP